MATRKQDPPPVRDWYVLIEETIGAGEGQRWSLTKILEFDHRADALKKAVDMAKDYQPRHPTMERRRKIFRVGEDTWVVWLEGATRSYHLRISVARPGLD